MDVESTPELTQKCCCQSKESDCNTKKTQKRPSDPSLMFVKASSRGEQGCLPVAKYLGNLTFAKY